MEDNINETKKKISESNKGKKHSKKTKRKIGLKNATKLTWNKVDKIREMYNSKQHSRQNLKNYFNIFFFFMLNRFNIVRSILLKHN